MTELVGAAPPAAGSGAKISDSTLPTPHWGSLGFCKGSRSPGQELLGWAVQSPQRQGLHLPRAMSHQRSLAVGVGVCLD